MDVFGELPFEEQKELLKIVIDDLTPETILKLDEFKSFLVEKINSISEGKIVFCSKSDKPINTDGRCCKNRKDLKNRYFNFYADGDIFIDSKGYCWSREDLKSAKDQRHPYSGEPMGDTFLEWSKPLPMEMIGNESEQAANRSKN
jgi:hypothetical protein